VAKSVGLGFGDFFDHLESFFEFVAKIRKFDCVKINKFLIKNTGCIKKPEFRRFFHVFSIRKFFSKMTLLGLILCGESIARIPEA
jgi:hypothetical protein